MSLKVGRRARYSSAAFGSGTLPTSRISCLEELGPGFGPNRGAFPRAPVPVHPGDIETDGSAINLRSRRSFAVTAHERAVMAAHFVTRMMKNLISTVNLVSDRGGANWVARGLRLGRRRVRFAVSIMRCLLVRGDVCCFGAVG